MTYTILFAVVCIVVFVFVKFILPRMLAQRKIKKPDKSLSYDDQGIEVAILSWFHDQPLCKIPASDIITLYEIIKPFLKEKTNDITPPIEDTRKRSIRNVHKEVPERRRRIIVRAWDDDRDVEILDDNKDKGEDSNVE
jgi:hypothetical protein